MSVQVKNLALTRVGGVHVSLEPSGKVSREEAYFGFTLTWLGKEYHADATADRYMASHWNGDTREEDRLTAWRVVVRSAYDPPLTYAGRSPLTSAGRRAADEQIEPIIKSWLASDAYTAARQRAYAHAIARAISEERYDAARARRVFDLHKHELNASDVDRLGRACDLLAQLLDALKDPE